MPAFVLSEVAFLDQDAAARYREHGPHPLPPMAHIRRWYASPEHAKALR